MSTPLIVFRRIESISVPVTLQWITEFSKKSSLIFASDNDEFLVNNFFENNWEDYQLNVEDADLSLFKAYEPIRLN